jgi:hypothetical protein
MESGPIWINLSEPFSLYISYNIIYYYLLLLLLRQKSGQVWVRTSLPFRTRKSP